MCSDASDQCVVCSMRAVCEHHAHSASLPPVMIVLAEGDHEVAIKVADQGGGLTSLLGSGLGLFLNVSPGIPRNGMPRLWTYAYTTANEVPEVTCAFT